MPDAGADSCREGRLPLFDPLLRVTRGPGSNSAVTEISLAFGQ